MPCKPAQKDFTLEIFLDQYESKNNYGHQLYLKSNFWKQCHLKKNSTTVLLPKKSIRTHATLFKKGPTTDIFLEMSLILKDLKCPKKHQCTRWTVISNFQSFSQKSTSYPKVDSFYLKYLPGENWTKQFPMRYLLWHCLAIEEKVDRLWHSRAIGEDLLGS